MWIPAATHGGASRKDSTTAGCAFIPGMRNRQSFVASQKNRHRAHLVMRSIRAGNHPVSHLLRGRAVAKEIQGGVVDDSFGRDTGIYPLGQPAS